ncbi:hypothetical protein NKY66_11050 [Sinorhizobium meliloti]|uniref:hypothetical protein n=1 Tax=Rhizobium meliloti TaxID=382 RepID=UPI003D655D83
MRVLEVIFYQTREGAFEFRAIVDGKAYESLGETSVETTVRTIAKQFGGFIYNEDRKAFETQSATTGAEPLKLISEFERQGFAVIMRGSLAHIDNLLNAA